MVDRRTSRNLCGYLYIILFSNLFMNLFMNLFIFYRYFYILLIICGFLIR